jgi:hypothetical protein
MLNDRSNRLLFSGLLLGAVFLAAAGSFAKDETQSPKQIGRFVRVVLPITGQTFEQTRRIVLRAMERAKKDGVRLVLIVEFRVPKGQKDFGRGSEFGASHDLLSYQ